MKPMGVMGLLTDRDPRVDVYALSVALIAALIVSLAVFSAQQEKQHYRERASTATKNISRLLAQNISDDFDKVDVVLRSVRTFYLEESSKRGHFDTSMLTAHLIREKSLMPEIINLQVTDKDGNVRFGDGIPKDSLVNLSDRDYFIRLRSDTTNRLVVTGPFVARISKQWVIVLSRRIEDADGSFAGVALASIGTGQFEKVLSSVALGPYGAATIRSTDLALVSRFPDTGMAVGSKVVSKQLRDIMLAHTEEGQYIAETALDEIERNNAYRRLQDYPFYVIVGLATDDYMGEWKYNVLKVSGLAGLAILMTCLAAFLVYRTNQKLAAEVAERAAQGAKLSELNRDFISFLENTPDLIYFKDKDSRFRFCSQALAKITGHASWRDMIGKHDMEVFPADTARIYYEEELPIFQEGKALLNKTDPYYDAQGKPGWVNTNKWPLFADDKKTVVGIFGVSCDTTELKNAEDMINELNRDLEQRVVERTEQLEAANKELEAFSYSVSHDLRAPLRAIDGFSRILLADYNDKLDDEGKRLLNVVRDNTQKMGQLIDDILAFSRTGRVGISFSEIDMERLVRSVVEEIKPSEGNLQVEIGAIPPSTGDPAMMHQVFVNLLSNAIKFSRSKEPAMIKVGGSIKEDEAVYYVKDNGAGFDMQYANKLFGVFQRLHTTNEFEGTGIGLAIVKRIVTRHGGRVWAEGKLNEGATIYFALPALKK